MRPFAIVVFVATVLCSGVAGHVTQAVAREKGEAWQLAVAWNQLAYDLAFAEDQFHTFKGQRTFAMMHIAMHDALNTVDPIYQRYGYSGEQTAADPLAAVAQAAYVILISQYPGQKKKLDDELASWLGVVPDGAAKGTGIALGTASAASILADRQHDGWNETGTYTFRKAPGQYQTTPDWNGFVVQPGFRNAKPFALESGKQFRPAPPPATTSPAYAEAFNEVKAYGGARQRDIDQSGYAIWWMEFAEGSVNRLARQLVRDRNIDPWTANRMFAQLNMALFDAYIAVWDSKYEFNHWRPYTAIRQAIDDGNGDTTADPAWEPLKPTPPFPEYVSAHAAGCAAAFAVLTGTFGNDQPFSMGSLTAPAEAPTRNFTSFDRAADECAASRVRLGWHFRYGVDEGLKLGTTVAGYVLKNRLNKRQ
jgi:hypothetical protein